MGWTEERRRLTKELCTLLMRVSAMKFGTFTLASGKLSPYYVDLRIVPSFPDAYRLTCDAFIQLITHDVGLDKFNRISGIPTAGIPFASAVAFQMKKPFLYTRKEVKTHGRERMVEGILLPGDKVLIMDDLITTGGSLINAAKAMRAEGGVVNDAVVLIDREEGGKETLAKEKIKLHSLTKMSEVAKVLLKAGTLSSEQYKSIVRQVKRE